MEDAVGAPVIELVELRRLRLPLVAPFRTSTGTTADRDLVLVRVVTDRGEGWGECAAMAEPTYTSEYVDGALDVMRRHLLPRLLDRRAPLGASGVGPALAGVQGHPMAKAALEMAVLDAELRAAGMSLARYLGAERDRVDAGVAVGITGSVPALLDAVAAFVDEGYVRVKLKVGPGWDLEPVAAVRERFGDALAVQVDANGAYRRADVAHLARLDAFDLLLVEQPLPPDDLLGHAELARRLRTPVCLDESVVSARSAAAAIALGACGVVNVKAGRVGGYLEARRTHDVCLAAGVPVWCGGMFETGLGRAANLALAALPGFTLPGDLSASGRHHVRDVTPPVRLEDGQLAVPTGPGVGVEVDLDAVEDLTVAVERVEPPPAG